MRVLISWKSLWIIKENLLASSIGDWCVLEVITLSDHQCIQERSHPVNTGRGGKVRSPFWNTKRLSKDKLHEHLEETRLIDELGWAGSAGVEAVGRPVVCPASKMPYSAAEIYPLEGWSPSARGMEKRKISSEARHKEKTTSMLGRLDRGSREIPMGSRL